LTVPISEKRTWIDPEHTISLSRQCALATLPRSTYYFRPQVGERAANLAIMHMIDRIYTKNPEFGVPRMTDGLRDLGLVVNHKRVARLMRVMGLQATLPGPHTSIPHPDHHVYPYLLRGRAIARPDEVWATDITYIPLIDGFVFLVAIIDWYSRYVLTWQLSKSLQAEFCIEALRRALSLGCPEIFNTDQGKQFTCEAFIALLLAAGVTISMNGRGRAIDNVIIERLWWTVKYEHVYPYSYETIEEVRAGLTGYFRYYNEQRRHSSLDKCTPAEMYFERARA
jgi:putative transposase